MAFSIVISSRKPFCLYFHSENILIKDDQVKLADFGSCRGVYSQPPFTEYISTRWYRPPECLLTDGYYNHKMDYWGVGCVFFEVLALFPLFPGNNEMDQVHKIHNILGTPTPELLEKFQKVASHMEFNFEPKQGTGIAKLIPNVSPEVQEIISKMLNYDQAFRISASQVLKLPYFRDLRDADKTLMDNQSISTNPAMRLTKKGIDSFSQQSKR
jgi:renal tumor antigen